MSDLTGELVDFEGALRPEIKKKITMERLYPLGDFKNIKFGDEISDIPEHLALDRDFVNKLRYLQIIDIEIMFRKYQELNKMLGQFPSYEEALAVLDDMRTKTFEDLKVLINKEK